MSTEYQNPPLCVDELMNRCMGEIDFATNVLQSFLDGCDDQMNELDQQLHDGQIEDAAKMAHRIKGSAATVGARPLQATMQTIEMMANDMDTSEIDLQIAQAKKEVMRLKAFAAENLHCS